jgi:hypothetical protein
MATKGGVHAAHMIALEVREEEVVHPRTAKCAVGREVELLSLHIVDEHAPVTVGIHLQNLVGGCGFPVLDQSGQSIIPISARSRRPIKVSLSIESISLRASSADSTGVLPRFTTYFGPCTEAAGLTSRIPPVVR